MDLGEMFESFIEIQHSRRQTFRNHLTKDQATIITIALTYQLNLKDVFDFLQSKECKIKGIKRLKNHVIEAIRTFNSSNSEARHSKWF